jgi:hypothetical protein
VTSIRSRYSLDSPSLVRLLFSHFLWTPFSFSPLSILILSIFGLPFILLWSTLLLQSRHLPIAPPSIHNSVFVRSTSQSPAAFQKWHFEALVPGCYCSQWGKLHAKLAGSGRPLVWLETMASTFSGSDYNIVTRGMLAPTMPRIWSTVVDDVIAHDKTPTYASRSKRYSNQLESLPISVSKSLWARNVSTPKTWENCLKSRHINL